MAESGVAGSKESPEKVQTVKIKHPLVLTLIAFLLGLAFEILFFGHPIGISFSIMVVFCLAGLFIAAWKENTTFAKENLFLVLPILFLSIMSFLRLEPLTLALNVLLTLMLLALWVRTFISGRLLNFGWIDQWLALILVPMEAWIRPWAVLGRTQKQIFKEGQRRGVLLAVIRGLLLALPILVIFLGLLMAADLIFQQRVETALEWLDMERVAEYAGRTIVVLLGMLFFLGAIVVALQDRSEIKLIGEEKPLMKPFLGIIESGVILGAVDLLFASFLAIQFTYLFGGEKNINLTGYTYAEYARRGFSELVTVGVLSLGMILVLAWVTKRQSHRVRMWFNLLSALLVVQVGFILASALTRLLLYEEAYGFTRLRTYTHLFIPWMGVALILFLGLLFLERLRYFASVAAACALGFTITLNLMNVDVFIVERNINRFKETQDLDILYVASLSEDAVPGLIRFAQELTGEDYKDLMRELACWNEQLAQEMDQLSWPSTHGSRNSARDAFQVHEDVFEMFEVYQEDWGTWWVEGETENQRCGQQKWPRNWD